MFYCNKHLQFFDCLYLEHLYIIKYYIHVENQDTEEAIKKIETIHKNDEILTQDKISSTNKQSEFTLGQSIF